MDEFEFIANKLRPLAGEGAFQLRDDAALLAAGVVSKDVIVEGVHFRPEDPLDRVAQKALRVNISDLLAKGCTPRDYLLGLVLPQGTLPDALSLFAKGLATDQAVYGLSLLGGDTTQGPADAPLMVSVTMIGVPHEMGPILRGGASPGDRVLVSGTIGDAGLGLKELLANPASQGPLIEAYQRPSPPYDISALIALYASACLDVSDGLAADAMHLATASDVLVKINADDVPLSKEGKRHVGDQESLIHILTCGDDYQSLMSVPPRAVAALRQAAKKKGIEITEIGEIKEGQGVELWSARYGLLTPDQQGYRHF